MFADDLQMTHSCRFILQTWRPLNVFKNTEYRGVNAVCMCCYAFAPYSGFW